MRLYLDKKKTDVSEIIKKIPSILNITFDKSKIEISAENQKGIWGFGERFDSLNQTGKIRLNKVYEKFTNQGENTYLPIPFALLSDFGIFIDTEEIFNFSSKKINALTIITIELPSSDEEVFFFAGKPSYQLKQLFEKKGNPILPPSWSFGPKIKWIKDNEPEIFSKTKHINFAPGFITAKLTGKFAIDRHSIQSCQPMIDIRTLNYTWNEEMCSYVCPSSMLPEIKNTTDIIGFVRKEISKECGIDEGVPVICGTTDAAAEAFSVGVLEPGDTLLMYGSSAFLINLSSKILDDTPYPGAPYLVDGLIDNCLGMGTAGSLTVWLKNVMAKDLIKKENLFNINAFDELFKEAEGIPVGSNGLLVLPYFQGKRLPIPNPYAKGAIFGLGLNHTRGDLVHAFFEGVGYGMSQMLNTIDSCSGIKNLIATGGGTKTPLWLQIVSDISGMKQKVPKIKIGASYGDALLAGRAIGKFKSSREIKRLIEFDYEILPDSNKHEEYKKFVKLYSDLYLNTKNIMKNII